GWISPVAVPRDRFGFRLPRLTLVGRTDRDCVGRGHGYGFTLVRRGDRRACLVDFGQRRGAHLFNSAFVDDHLVLRYVGLETDQRLRFVVVVLHGNRRIKIAEVYDIGVFVMG